MEMEVVLTAALYVTSLVGLTANLIIVAANVRKWKSLNSLQTCDKILSSLAISRSLCLLCIIIHYSLLQFLPWLMLNNILLSALNILGMSMFYNSLWIATILCVFYCIKIVTYNYKLFAFLKTRISTLVPWLLSASLLISLISSLPFGWVHSNLKLQEALNESTGNMTMYTVAVAEMFTNPLLVFAVGCFPPFIIYCVTNILLIHFLLVHTRRMRGNESHIRSPNLRSHYNALKSVSLFLLLQIMYLISSGLSITGIFSHLKLSIFINGIILCSPPLFHSLYIISSSTEIKKMFVLMCLGLFRCS